MKSKLLSFIIFLIGLNSVAIQAQQLDVKFNTEVETFITTNFYKKQGKNLGVEKGTRYEINESKLKIKDFKTLLYNDFATYYAISEYQKKGSEAFMDEINAAFMSSKIIKYRIDSKNKSTLITEEDKKNGVTRKIELQNTTFKVLATVLLYANNKVVIRFAESTI